jgi:hypothetical protein
LEIRGLDFTARLWGQTRQPDCAKVVAGSHRSGMVRPKPELLALHQFYLDRSRALVVALAQQKISQGGNRTQPCLVLTAEMPAEIPDGPFQKRPRIGAFAIMPERQPGLSHQTERVRVIRTEQILVRAQSRQHAGQIVALDTAQSRGLHGLNFSVSQTCLSSSIAYIVV